MMVIGADLLMGGASPARIIFDRLPVAQRIAKWKRHVGFGRLPCGIGRPRTMGLRGRECSRPRSVANRTAEPWIDLMESLRREYRLTAEEIATKLKLARSTVAA